MPTYNLSAFAGAGAQFFDDNGAPLVGGKVYTYASGTTTPRATYTTSAGTVANTNPIILDAAGRTPNEIWLIAGSLYKFILRTSTDVLIGTYDGVPSINDSFSTYNLLSSVAGTNTITATATPTLTSYQAGATYSFIAANTNTGATTISIDGLAAKSITKNGSVALTAGDIQAGKMMLIEYDGTVFQLMNNIVYGSALTNATINSLTSPLTVANGGTGAATFTANAVLLGNNTAAFQTVAPGTAGNLLTSNGTTWTSAAPTAAGIDVQTFTAFGTWTKPTGYVAGSRVLIQCWGGGASGGKSGSGVIFGGGGGGGGYNERWITLSSMGATETITIGAGGVAKTTAGTGLVGGTTSVGSLVYAYGGGGGGYDWNTPVDGAYGCGGGGGGQLGAGFSGDTGAYSTAGKPGSPGTNGGLGGKYLQSTGAGEEGSASDVGGGGGGSMTAAPSALTPTTGGAAVWGGGGGGGGNTAAFAGLAGGASSYGGAGGASANTTAVAGSQPGGGGGGSGTGNSGAGGAGQVIITVFPA